MDLFKKIMDFIAIFSLIFFSLHYSSLFNSIISTGDKGVIFKYNKPLNISDIFKQYQLWSSFWGELNSKNEEEFTLLMNLIFPQIKNVRSMLFDCKPDMNYKYTSFHDQIFPDESYYRWFESNPHSNVKQFFNDQTKVLIKTKDFQEKIFHHQNPPKCEGKRYIEIPLLNWGLGSVLIHYGRYISMAINHGYIAIMPRKQWIWASLMDFCGNDTSFTCVFEDISNCTDYYYSNYKSKITLNNPSNSYPPPFFYPLWVEQLLKDTPIHKSLESYLFYSSCQILGYLTRPTKKVVHWMNEYTKKDPIKAQKIDLAIHIRHGDKASEMKLVPTMEYLNAIKIIQRLEKKKDINVLISTEDQSAVELLEKNAKDIKIYYFHHSRTNGGYSAFLKNATYVCLISLLNLRECIKAKYFIGT